MKETTGEGTIPVTLEIDFSDAGGTYAINLGSVNGKDGMSLTSSRDGEGRRWTECHCTQLQEWGNGLRLTYQACRPSTPLSGKLEDPNHIRANYFDRKEHQRVRQKRCDDRDDDRRFVRIGQVENERGIWTVTRAEPMAKDCFRIIAVCGLLISPRGSRFLSDQLDRAGAMPVEHAKQ